ncbi:MAG: hypothetical protein HOB32_02740 [Nitrospina sp.]|nr:hypothetical protein [Nitrospina sp.]
MFSIKTTKVKYLAIYIVIIYLIFALTDNVYSQDIISFNQQAEDIITVPSKIDLTKLSRGGVFKVEHEDFVLQFFFNNRDILGLIFKRKPSIGIMVHLCLYRSCEETPYDLRKVIAKALEPPYDKTFFSIKFPKKLQYEFQGLEFLKHK